MSGPTVEVGLFSYGALDISPDLKSCYDYQLEPKPQQLRHTIVVIVGYTLKQPLNPGATCPVTEAVSGKAFIDPATMQILRIEQRRPQHDVFEGKLGLWSWSVDYGMVNLDGKVFWLPTTISTQSFLDSNPHAEWSLVATYRNYHLLTVHSTILPMGAAPAP